MPVCARKVILFVLVLVAVPLARSVAQQSGLPAGWSDGYAYVNGARIHYYRATPAPGKRALVMVHGVTDAGILWATVAEKLQGSYDIYMLDARGHGLSDPFTSSDDANTLVKDVVSFVGTMKLDKPILMGHSLGAATVMRVGAEYPDLAKAIIMLDPGLGRIGARPGAAPPAASTTTPAAPSRATASAASSAQASAPNRLSFSMYAAPESLVAQNNTRFEDFVAYCDQKSPKWGPLDCQYLAVAKRQYHGPYSEDQRKALSGPMAGAGGALGKITVPALILKADATPEIRKANEEAAKVMQRGRLVHIDGAGHNLHHEKLERTVEVLKEFLSTL